MNNDNVMINNNLVIIIMNATAIDHSPGNECNNPGYKVIKDSYL